jgi:hypothetical protein
VFLSGLLEKRIRMYEHHKDTVNSQMSHRDNLLISVTKRLPMVTS